MGIERFYLDAELLKGELIILQDKEHHHIQVLRLEPNETVELINGRGSFATAQISSISKHATQLRVLKTSHHSPSSCRIAAAIPLMRPSKLEWVVEKGTELGADRFIFFTAEYSEKEHLSTHQIDRLKAIAISAIKQSDRLYLPSFEIYSHLSDVLQMDALFFFGDLSPNAPFFQREEAPLVIFVTGPEKGFSLKELSLLQSKGRGVRLNPNILRAETAPLAALTLFFSLR